MDNSNNSRFSIKRNNSYINENKSNVWQVTKFREGPLRSRLERSRDEYNSIQKSKRNNSNSNYSLSKSNEGISNVLNKMKNRNDKGKTRN